MDVLLVGSSLQMTAVFPCDEANKPHEFNAEKAAISRSGVQPIWGYTHAYYLRDRLSEAAGKSVDVYNMTIAASMVCDADLILLHLLSSSRRPKVIVYGLCLRDFVDNLVPPVGGTSTYQLIGNLWDALTVSKNFDVLQQGLLTALCSYYGIRDNFKCFLIQQVANYLNHPETLADSVELQRNPKVAMTSLAKANSAESSRALRSNQQVHSAVMADQLADYRLRYYPVNSEQFQRELECFSHLLNLCKQNNIKAVVINMPLSSSARALIKPGLYREYLQQVTT